VPRLFVYGTLRRGAANARELGGAVWEADVRTDNGYALIWKDGYPALVIAAQGAVTGEVYRTSSDHLTRLDAFEGVPELYRRGMVLLADGSVAEAYFAVVEDGTAHERLASGDYFDQPGSAPHR
jgi:gamma-glutamylaminecyclotransferase